MFTSGQDYIGDGGVKEEKEVRKKTFAEKNQEIIDREKSNWVWFQILDTLAHGDVLKYDAVTDLNLILCFNKLAYDKSFPDSYTNLKLTSGYGFGR